ncbi:hypothetical protein EUTSA_v10009399mg [Eutrema salsugineum]|uniref:Uncharacterized protein n=1 Tax=Eutrema salsugineum TaxID=72664 RepID=V4L1K3_EUTSA|nr:uncharacterized protein LOC18991869 [Eutrema salsugineum]ESQ33618.1 hypothetical protein EUTSA_v10009399mg [Eutrema salsugineum]
MASVSENNQPFPISDDEPEKFTAYSTAVHKVIVMVNAGILGLLQLLNQEKSTTTMTSPNDIIASSVFETNKPALLCFCLLVLLYAVLRVVEAIDVRRRRGFVARLVGHTSHLLGGLAAIVLISVVYATFALVLLLLWFLCFFSVVYNVLRELLIYSGPNTPQSPPV